MSKESEEIDKTLSIVEEADYSDPFAPKWKRQLLKLVPTYLIKHWNLFSYKNDDVIYKIETKWDNFCDFLTPKFIYRLRYYYSNNLSNFFKRVISSWSYFKFGWTDHHFDYSFLLKLMRFKISKMESCMRSNDRHLGSSFHADQMRVVIECLDRLIEDDYTSFLYEELYSIFPKSKPKEDWLFSSMNRKVYLSSSGKKVVLYESTIEEKEDNYHELYSKLSTYYNELKLADLRVVFFIMTPILAKEAAKIKLINNKIIEDNNVSSDNWEEMELLLKKGHHGIWAWWD